MDRNGTYRLYCQGCSHVEHISWSKSNKEAGAELREAGWGFDAAQRLRCPSCMEKLSAAKQPAAAVAA